MQEHPCKPPTLAVFSSEPFYNVNGEAYFTRSKLDTLMLQSSAFQHVVLALPADLTAPQTQELIKPPANCGILPLYTLSSTGFFRRILSLTRTVLIFLRNFRGWDVIYVRLFFWDGLVAGLMSILLRRAMFASLHGDIEEALLINWKSRPYPKVFIQTVATLLRGLTRFICNRSSVLFVSGPSLAEKYAPTRADFVPFMDTSYTDEDIFLRGDTCQSPSVRLLYVGELVPRKGINYLLRAVSLLRQNGHAVTVRLVGAGEIHEYQTETSNLGMTEYVSFAGYVPFGPKLFAEYRQADIFVLPAVGTEGWSRVLVEANAHSLPVVGTEVGSVGRSIREYECGLVAATASSEDLARQLMHIMTDGHLRKKLIRGSLRRAQQHTRDKEEKRARAALARAYPNLVRSLET